jgi:radical SAM superfamily enzyme YgiQ (UPF0313 family)
MKVTLINPPSPFLINQKTFPPLGILYLASYLIKSGNDVEVIDLVEKEGDLEKALRNSESELYGITATTPQYPWAKKIKDILKARGPDAKICVGGAHPSSLPQQCLNDSFDFVVIGEGERALQSLIQSIVAGSVKNSLLKSPYIEDLDSFPFPARDLININNYGYDIEGNRATTVITSRGCPFRCAFCSKDVWGNGVRYHSVDYVIEEINQIKERFGFRHFLFLDDVFTLNKKRLLEICSQLRPLDIRWRCYARSDDITKEILIAMKEAGCVEIGLGVESGSQKILDAVNKGLRVEDATRFVKNCKDVGITVNAFIMIGLPGETYQTVQETKRWMEKNLPEKFGFNIYAPYVGTDIFRYPERYDLQIYPMPDEDSWVKGRQGEYKSFVSTDQLSREEILRLFNELFAYYSNLIGWRPGIGCVSVQNT